MFVRGGKHLLEWASSQRSMLDLTQVTPATENAHLPLVEIAPGSGNAFCSGANRSCPIAGRSDNVAFDSEGPKPMIWTWVSSLLFTGWNLTVLALFAPQDPFTVAREAYQLQMENEWARVVRIHYNPHQSIVSHDHPRVGTIYVYLGNSGSVLFKHTGNAKFTADRPPVKIGGFRLGKATQETHELESLSDEPTDLLRVELKTIPADEDTFHGRYPPEEYPSDQNFQKVRFENAQVRISQVMCLQQSACVDGPAEEPHLWIALSQSQFTLTDKNGLTSDVKMETGETVWAEPDSQLRVANTGVIFAAMLRIDLKTKPQKDSDLSPTSAP
jgi:hypothetical protein